MNRPRCLRKAGGSGRFNAVIDAGILDAIQKQRFYILPQPEWIEVIQLRTEKLLRMGNPQSPAAEIAKPTAQGSK